MVDLDHCSYSTIWAADKDCYRGNICYLSRACAFFLNSFSLTSSWSALLFFCFFSKNTSHLCFSLFPFGHLGLLFSLWCPPPSPCLCLSHPLTTISTNSPLSLLIPPSPCVESGAAWLSLLPCWAGACLKGPRTLTHWGAPTMPEMPSPPILSSAARITPSSCSSSLQDRRKGQTLCLSLSPSCFKLTFYIC